MKKAWLHQLLCCFTLALIIMSIVQEMGHLSLVDRLAHPTYSILLPAFRTFHLEPTLTSSYLLLASLDLAAIMFLLLRGLSYVRTLRSPLVISTGVLCVAAYPLGCLWSRWHWGRVSEQQIPLFLCETFIVIIAAVFYFYRKWPISNFLTFLLLTIHLGFWLSISEGFRRDIDISRAIGYAQSRAWLIIVSAMLLPLLSLFSSVFWALYVHSSGEFSAAK